MSSAKERLEQAIEDASNAFWAEIAKQYPEVKTGDFGPEETFAWDEACRRAVRTWLRWNLHVSPREGSRWALRQPIEKYPHFTVPAGYTGTIMEADCDLIRLRMDAHIPGCEEWDNEIVWSENDDPAEISALNAFMQDAELLSEVVASQTLEEKQGVELQIAGKTVTVTHHTDGDGDHYLKLRGVNCDLDGDMPGEYYLNQREPLLPAQMTVVMSFKPDTGTADLDRTLMQAGIDGLLGVDAVFPGDISSEDTR